MRILIASLAFLLLQACSQPQPDSLQISATPLNAELTEEEPLIVRFAFDNPTDSTMGLKVPTSTDWTILFDGAETKVTTNIKTTPEYFLLTPKSDTSFTVDFYAEELGLAGKWIGSHQLSFAYLNKDAPPVSTNTFAMNVKELSEQELLAREALMDMTRGNTEQVDFLAEQFKLKHPNSIYTNRVKLRQATSLLYEADKQEKCQALLWDVYNNSKVRKERVEAATFLSHVLNRDQQYGKLYQLWKGLDAYKAKRFKELADATGK